MVMGSKPVMNLNKQSLIELSNTAKLAAVKAGTMIENYVSADPSRESIEVKTKKTGFSLASQVVTEVDLKSEKIILDIIKPTLKKFDLALLSEESADDQSRFEKDYFWCIDPLDGTLAFTEARAGFSVSIALVSKQGIPQIGVVYDPSTQSLYSAIRGDGLFKNDQPMVINQYQPAENENKRSLTLIAERNLMESNEFKEVVASLRKTCTAHNLSDIKIVEGGGAVINACQVLENPPSAYFKLPKPEQGGGSAWDFAATSCLFNESTGTVSDVHGKQLELNKQGDTFMNGCGVVYASDKNFSTALIEIIKRKLK